VLADLELFDSWVKVAPTAALAILTNTTSAMKAIIIVAPRFVVASWNRASCSFSSFGRRRISRKGHMLVALHFPAASLLGPKRYGSGVAIEIGGVDGPIGIFVIRQHSGNQLLGGQRFLFHSFPLLLDSGVGDNERLSISLR
jgi:hypothetical protein